MRAVSGTAIQVPFMVMLESGCDITQDTAARQLVDTDSLDMQDYRVELAATVQTVLTTTVCIL